MADPLLVQLRREYNVSEPGRTEVVRQGRRRTQRKYSLRTGEVISEKVITDAGKGTTIVEEKIVEPSRQEVVKQYPTPTVAQPYSTEGISSQLGLTPQVVKRPAPYRDVYDVNYRGQRGTLIVKQAVEKPSENIKKPTAFGGAYQDVKSGVDRFVVENVVSPVRDLRNKPGSPFKPIDFKKSKELVNINLGFGGRVYKGAAETVLYKPSTVIEQYYLGRGIGKFLNLKPVSSVSNTVVGRGIGTGVVGLTTVSLVKGYKEAKSKESYIGTELVKFGALGKGIADTSKGTAFKEGVTLFTDVKRGTGKFLDRFNPYALKTEVKTGMFERGRTLPEGKVEVVNIPNVGEVVLKPIPSQQAGFNILKGYTGKSATIISATTSNPYRPKLIDFRGKKGEIFNPKSFVTTSKFYEVKEVPGGSPERVTIGGIERGQFFSLPEIGTGKAQAFTYYLGEGATLKDLSSGSAKFSLFSTNKLLVEPRTLISPYSKQSLKYFGRGKTYNPSVKSDLNLLRYLASKESVAGKTKAGFGGAAGYRTELESISSIGTIKTRTPTTFRGKVGKYFGLGDYFIRTQSGKKIEVFTQKTEPFTAKDIKISTKSKDLKLDLGKGFDVSSSTKLSYKPYKDIGRTFVSSSKLSSRKSSSFKSSINSIRSSVSSPTSSFKSNVSNVSSNISKSSRSLRSSFKSTTSSYSSVFSKYSSLSSTSSSSSSSFKSFKSPSISLPKVDYKFKQQPKTFKSTFKLPKRTYRYTPSVESTIFNVRGRKPSKIGIESGLILRPLRS